MSVFHCSMCKHILLLKFIVIQNKLATSFLLSSLLQILSQNIITTVYLITSLAVHMIIQKAYAHFHPPPRGGYYTLFILLDKVYNSAGYLGGIFFFLITI